jgi:hypothetical protein
MNFKEEYSKHRLDLDFEINVYTDKYKEIILSSIKPQIIPYIEKELSKVLEVLIRIESNFPMIVNPINPINHMLGPRISKPDNWLGVNESLKFISNQLDNYYYSMDMNYEIEKEYINILTKKKTYLVKTKNGSVLFDELKQEEILFKELNNILEFCIDYIIEPEKRKQIIRKLKINNILV